MKIGLGVSQFLDFKPSKNLETIATYTNKAKNKGIDMLLFGETVLNGFKGLSWDIKKDIKDNAIAQDSKYIKKIKELAIRNGVSLGVGYYEQYKGKVYDSYIIISKQGEKILNYRRVSKSWKPSLDLNGYSQGGKFGNFKYLEKKFGLIICGDLWWKDKYLEEIKNLECDYLLWPLYIDYSRKDWRDYARQEYQERISKVNKDTLVINSIHNKKEGANGGAWFISNTGELKQKLAMGSEGILMI